MAVGSLSIAFLRCNRLQFGVLLTFTSSCSTGMAPLSLQYAWCDLMISLPVQLNQRALEVAAICPLYLFPSALQRKAVLLSAAMPGRKGEEPDFQSFSATILDVARAGVRVVVETLDDYSMQHLITGCTNKKLVRFTLRPFETQHCSTSAAIRAHAALLRPAVVW